MKEFERGILFTCGMALFGSGMYKLGKLKEREKILKHWKLLNDDLNEIVKWIAKVEELEEKEEES